MNFVGYMDIIMKWNLVNAAAGKTNENDKFFFVYKSLRFVYC